jgi:hypothetical protein
VFPRLKVVAILTAWFLASGSQWDAVQIFAWARMFGENVRQLPVGEALARTFSPAARCTLCVAVTEGKQQQQGGTTPAPKFEDRTLSICEPAPLFVFAAAEILGRLENRPAVPGLTRARPPVPPPRV